MSLYEFGNGAILRGGGGFAGYERVIRTVTDSPSVAADGSLLSLERSIVFEQHYENAVLSGFVVPGVLTESTRTDTTHDGSQEFSRTVFAPKASVSSSGLHYFQYAESVIQEEGGILNSIGVPVQVPWRVRERWIDSISEHGHVTYMREGTYLTEEGIALVESAPAAARLREALSPHETSMSAQLVAGTRSEFEGWISGRTVSQTTSDCRDGVSRCSEGGSITTQLDVERDPMTGAVTLMELNAAAAAGADRVALEVERDVYGNTTRLTQSGENGGGQEEMRTWSLGYDTHEHMYRTWWTNPEGHTHQRAYWQATGSP
ncbi:MAG: hypothetical protein AAFY60_17890, partial [Myxococcota bacterium]